jgi:hypothetical protein
VKPGGDDANAAVTANTPAAMAKFFFMAILLGWDIPKEINASAVDAIPPGRVDRHRPFYPMNRRP